MMPTTDIPNPQYSPKKPLFLTILTKQSESPLNYRDPPSFALLPISIASLVLAKYRGYTKRREMAPAAPPEAKFPTKNFQNSFFLS